MSDTDDTDDSERKKNGKKASPAERDAERAKPEIIVKDKDLFMFLEELFYGEPENAHYPECIDVRVVTGRYHEKLGAYIDKTTYAPPKANQAAIDKGAGNPKPSREQLGAISNAILHKMQRDCDQSHRPMTYGVHAWHMSMGDEPYARHLKRCKPQGKYANDMNREHNPEDEVDDEGDGIEKRFSTQVLNHQAQMVELLGGGFETHSIRQDKMIERLIAQNEKLQERVLQGFDIIERALSMESERREKLENLKLKNDIIRRGAEMGIGLAPSLFNALLGKQMLPTAETPETITIKNFIKPREQGGILEPEQSRAIFGVYSPEPECTLIKEGILTLAQGQLLFDVAHCRIPADQLERLLPGGDLMVNDQQAAQLMQTVQMDQLAPILLILDTRMKARQRNSQQ